MIIACKCLNTVISLDIDSGSSPSSSTVGLESVLSSVQKDEKYQKNSKFSKELLKFIRNHAKKQPLNDLQLNTSQKDLVLTIPIRNWEINYCLNCNTITHAVQQTSNTLVINDSLQKKYDEMVANKADQSFSSTFGITMINHHHYNHQSYNNHQTHPNKLQLQAVASHHHQSDERLLRLKNLEKTLEQRIRTEIAETNERIARYSEQQFALLKNFREKSESEYQNLVSLVQNVPENLFEMQFSSNNDEHDDQQQQKPEHPTSSDASDTSAINNTSDTQQQITSFDTPPATPESIPMSVGNSPVFRQQNQQQQPTPQQSTASNVLNGFRGLLGAVNNGAVHNNSSTSIMSNNNNNLDDCLFELEGLETYPVSVAGNSNNGNNMSDDEDDETEDAQDALGELDSNASYGRRFTIASSYNVAKSVPIGIAQSFEDEQKKMSRSRRNNFDSDDEILDDNIDIAASIKALAKSVHGDKVFGELPRPRFSYKI
ncbi:Lobe family protein [Megaselia abdita]